MSVLPRVSPATADMIHVLLPAVLVGCGVGIAQDKALWLQSFAELFIKIASALLLLAGIVDAGCSVVSACKRLQPQKSEPKQRLSEALETTRAAWIFSSLAAWPLYQMRLGSPTALVFTLAEAQPSSPTSLPLYLLKIAAVTLLVDGYMYGKHYMLHSRVLWVFHRGHHQYHNPSPFASFAVQPVEAFLTFWPVTLLVLPEAKVWAHAYAVWTCGFVALNLYLHAGYESRFIESLLRPLYLNSSAFHNMHHEKTIQNFGELCYVWDWLLGTGAHPSPGTQGEVGKGEGKGGEN